jgi:hypothetical protein
VDFPDHWALVSLLAWDPIPREYEDPKTKIVMMRHYCVCPKGPACAGVHPFTSISTIKEGERRIAPPDPVRGIGQGIGVLTGSRSGILGIDLDRKHANVDGVTNFRKLVGDDIGALDTYIVKTPGNGLHFYYAITPEQYGIKSSAGKLAPGVDVRGEGGFLVGEGSHKPNGRYVRGRGDPRRLAPLPKVLWDLLVAKAQYGDVKTGAPAAAPLIIMESPSTPESRKRIALTLRRLSQTPPGHRNDECFRTAADLGDMVRAHECTTLEAREAFLEIVKHWPDLNKSLDTFDRGLQRGRNKEKPGIVIAKTGSKMATNDAAIAALASNRDVYVFNNRLARYDGNPAGGIESIREYRIASLRETLSESAEWYTFDKEGEKKLTRPGDDTVEEILERGYWPGVRTILAYSPCPIVRKDLTWSNLTGYDSSTEVYQTKELDIPKRMPAKDAFAALSKLVGQFPFARPCDRSAWFAALLTPILYFAIDGCTPVFIFDAPESGSGKTFLADAAGIIFGGTTPPVESLSKEEELSKKMIAHGKAGTRVIKLDNIKTKLGGQTLEAMTTSREYTGRELGHSKILSVKVSMVWYITGNNIQTTEDMLRRAVQCRIEPTTEKHSQQEIKYDIPNFMEHVRDHREHYLCAALSLIDHYREAGMPMPRSKLTANFESWHRLVVGIIEWLGMEAPNSQDLAARSIEIASKPGVIDAVAAFGAEGVRLAEVGRMSPDRRVSTLTEALQCEPKYATRELSRWVGRVGSIANGQSCKIVLRKDRLFGVDSKTGEPVVGPQPLIVMTSAAKS